MGAAAIVERAAAVDAAVAEAGRVFKRGETIPRAWLETAFGCDAEADAFTFLNLLGRFKNAMLEQHRMDLSADGSFDQRILLASEIVEGAPVRDFAREMSRSRSKLRRRVYFVAEDDLSAQERRRLNDLRAFVDTHLATTGEALDVLTRSALPEGGAENDEE